MFDILTKLTKATVGVVIETPIAVVADVVTLGGELSDHDGSYTGEALSKVTKNLSDITEPD